LVVELNGHKVRSRSPAGKKGLRKNKLDGAEAIHTFKE